MFAGALGWFLLLKLALGMSTQ